MGQYKCNHEERLIYAFEQLEQPLFWQTTVQERILQHTIRKCHSENIFHYINVFIFQNIWSSIMPVGTNRAQVAVFPENDPLNRRTLCAEGSQLGCWYSLWVPLSPSQTTQFGVYYENVCMRLNLHQHIAKQCWNSVQKLHGQIWRKQTCTKWCFFLALRCITPGRLITFYCIVCILIWVTVVATVIKTFIVPLWLCCRTQLSWLNKQYQIRFFPQSYWSLHAFV